MIARADIARHIGAHLAARRIERKLTQQEVAKQAGISRQALSEMERGTQLPAWESIYRIAVVFKCEVWDLTPRVAQVRE